MIKTFFFKLYNSKRNKHLMRLINIAGLIYNHCIALHRRYYRLFGKHIRKFTMINHYFRSRNIEGKVKTVTVKRDGVINCYEKFR